MRTAVKQGVSNWCFCVSPETGQGPGKPMIMSEKPNKINPCFEICAAGPLLKNIEPIALPRRARILRHAPNYLAAAFATLAKSPALMIVILAGSMCFFMAANSCSGFSAASLSSNCLFQAKVLPR